MKRSLIITAHPSSKGFTHKIAESYIIGAREAGNETKLLDLYAEDNKQDPLRFENIGEITTDPQKERMQSLVTWADELVIIYPLWWFSAPAVLKNFFDVNFSAGFAYRYKKVPILKGMPVGLLSGKTARLFVTCDGPKLLYKLILTPFKISIKYFTLRLCGIKVSSFTIFDRMRWRDDSKRNSWLAKVKKLAKK